MLPKARHANTPIADCSLSGRVAWTTNSCWNSESLLLTELGKSCSHWLLLANWDHKPPSCMSHIKRIAIITWEQSQREHLSTSSAWICNWPVAVNHCRAVGMLTWVVVWPGRGQLPPTVVRLYSGHPWCRLQWFHRTLPIPTKQWIDL